MKRKFMISVSKDKIISKKRVMQVFQDAMPCTIVSGMPGFGKTAVFAKEAEQMKEQVRWYNLDLTDNDVECFLTCLEYLWDSIDSKGRTSPAVNMDTRLLSLSERAQQWEGRRYLIFDNYQVISSEQIGKILVLLQQYAGEKVSFIILTNQDVPKGMMPEIVKGRAVLLSEDDLRLSEEEVWECMGAASGVSREIVALLTRQLYGWPLGIRCVMEYLTNSDISVSGEISWDRILRESMLADYLDEMLWDKCTEKMKMFFMETAVLEEFSWELCQEVLSEQITRKDFEKIVSHHGLLHLTKETGENYTYAEMFCRYLCWQISKDRKKELAGKAALWYQKRHDFRRVVSYAIKGEKDYLLVVTMEQYQESLLSEENRDLLEIIIRYLESHAVLLSAEASGIVAQYFYSVGNVERMEEYLNMADSSFGKENKFSCYRSLYRALNHYTEDKDKYEKQINHALFFLKEINEKLPWLSEKDKRRLESLTGKEEKKKQNGGLKVHTFGSFQVVATRDERELAWRTKKGRELFAFLLDIEGKAVERRQLIEVLWQEDIPGNAVAMLHNMIYNIRKELSAYRLETILTYENKRYRLDDSYITSDLSQIKRLTRLVEKKDIEKLQKHTANFIHYWGGYLEDIDSQWAEGRRRYYDEIYIKGCFLLAEKYAQKRDEDTALILYKNILTLDPYSEQTVEKMLFLYGRQKKWDQLRRCYRDFVEVMERDLGIEPGEEVVAAYGRYLK